MSNPMRTGGQGDTTYYVRNGEQIARQRRNNSNYGSTARRSEAQQEIRTRWSNVINFYKECRAWMPKAFENKKRSQSDYNVFMNLNVADSPYYLTKSQALAGVCIPYGFIISRGSLPPVILDYTYSTDVWVSNIKCTVAFEANLKIGVLSQNIIDNNPTFRNGDNIALVSLWYQRDAAQMVYCITSYDELTLDVTSDAIWGANDLSRFFVINSETWIAIDAPGGGAWSIAGVALIHTRKSGGQLQVSTQRIDLVPALNWDTWASDSQKAAAIASYGVDGVVPLEPGS